VRGLTTAATLWVVAAIGMAAGAGYYSAAVLGTALVLVSLWPLRIAAHKLSGRIRAVSARLVVEVPKGGSSAPVLAALEDAGAEPKSLEFDEEQGRRRIAIELAIELELELAQRSNRSAVVARLMEQEGVLAAEWSE
jgi:putative Mg2+ transporter-C (MgtC) family protein